MRTMIAGLFVVLFTVLANSANAASINFDALSITQDDNEVRINVETFERSSMCALKVKKLDIQTPDNGIQSKIVNLGKIEVTFEEDREAVCLQAHGPHRGALVLTKGLQLPALEKGDSYILKVNGFETPETLIVE